MVFKVPSSPSRSMILWKSISPPPSPHPDFHLPQCLQELGPLVALAQFFQRLFSKQLTFTGHFHTSESCFSFFSLFSDLQPWKWRLFCQKRGTIQAVVKPSSLKPAFQSSQAYTEGTISSILTTSRTPRLTQRSLLQLQESPSSAQAEIWAKDYQCLTYHENEPLAASRVPALSLLDPLEQTFMVNYYLRSRPRMYVVTCTINFSKFRRN